MSPTLSTLFEFHAVTAGCWKITTPKASSTNCCSISPIVEKYSSSGSTCVLTLSRSESTSALEYFP